MAAEDGLEVWRGPGTGPPVVAVHGLEGSWSDWGPIAPRLPGGTPYALRLPWHAGTDFRWRREATPGEWLARGLALVPEPPTTLMAHSFGATVLLGHLSRLTEPPAGLSAVVLIAPVYRPASLPVSDELYDGLLGLYRQVLRLGLEATLGPKAARMDPEIRTLMEERLLERAVSTGFPVFYEEYVASGAFALTGIKVPTLVVAGTTDGGLPVERATALHEGLPSAEIRLRPEYGHFCHLEQIPQLSEDIDQFLSCAADTAAPPNRPVEAIRPAGQTEPPTRPGDHP
ncbi:alpha/beta fold hydrolase [Streptomyces sp. NPDC058045]|uniref:alpha/beta fold hydrolase n=1 Tax=Streptomyces sp. NPDC058045 TaxID=3346311 RepID=UPI0036F182F3